MTPHIEAKLGDYYPTVLMPGDPLRSKYIAENFLTDVILINSVRNCLGYSGKYKGKEISVQASGMGQPSLGIYAHELFNVYDVKQIIRVGTCGGISPQVKVGDIVVAMTASTDTNMTSNLINGFSISPCCDFNLLKKFTDVCSNCFVGSMVASDYFYQPNKDWYKPFVDMGVLAVDMETHFLYYLSMINNKKSLSVNTVSDHLLNDEQMTSKERQIGLNKMIEFILESI